MKKIIIPIVAAVIIAGGAGFYGGMAYGKSSPRLRAGGQANASGSFLGGGQNSQRGFGAGTRGGMGGGITAGEILSTDATSITVKMRDGGSKIVFVSSSTAVIKAISGSLSDLAQGEQVVVAGSANSDGSVTAQSVQIRPPIQTNN